MARHGVVVTALALTLAAASLLAIGPAPALRIDPLWVNGRREEVQAFFLAVAVAALGSVPALMSRPTRRLAAAIWIAGLLLAVLVFRQRLGIICDVAARYAL